MDMPLKYGSHKTAWRRLRSGRMKRYGIGYSRVSIYQRAWGYCR
jgi:hypothetical protein